MLKLVFHSVLFGPLSLEYDKPVVRVGSSHDNDLVLLHDSVQAQHCVLWFGGEMVKLLPPECAAFAEADLARLEGAVYRQGDQLQIGALGFALAHSGRTVALPAAASAHAVDRTGSPGELATGTSVLPGQPHYHCARCNSYVPEAGIKKMGLVGQAKRCFCPKCGSEVTLVEPSPTEAEPVDSSLGRMWRRFTTWLGAKPEEPSAPDGQL